MDAPLRKIPDTPLRNVRANIVQSIRAYRVQDLQQAAETLQNYRGAEWQTISQQTGS
jgi:hypothetical protein